MNLVLNSEVCTLQILGVLNNTAPTFTSYPDKMAKFPMIICNEPIQKPNQKKMKIDLLFTVDVWHNSIFETSRLFDKIIIDLSKMNIMLVNNTPNFQDPITKKWRKTGNFETRYNCIANTYEINR